MHMTRQGFYMKYPSKIVKKIIKNLHVLTKMFTQTILSMLLMTDNVQFCPETISNFIEIILYTKTSSLKTCQIFLSNPES